MKHEDFNTLDLEFVLDKVLTYCQQQTHATGVHWLSAYGLKRVSESSNETWEWAFSTVDVAGRHVVSRPKGTDMWDLFHVWRKVAQLYPLPWRGMQAGQVFTKAPTSYYVQPVTFNGVLVGILLFDGLTQPNAAQLYAKIKDGLDVAAKYIAFAYQNLEARTLSYVDEVTGLYNQRYLPIALDHEIGRAKRDNSQFSLLFLDIDYFKMVNDGRGHQVGSRLLLELGKILRGQVRGCDYAFRYGGDEFIVLLGNSNAEASKKVAERIRKAVESTTFSVEGHNLNLTVSIGLACYPEHAHTASGLIQIADQAMYYGKRKSRNIVFVAS